MRSFTGRAELPAPLQNPFGPSFVMGEDPERAVQVVGIAKNSHGIDDKNDFHVSLLLLDSFKRGDGPRHVVNVRP